MFPLPVLWVIPLPNGSMLTVGTLEVFVNTHEYKHSPITYSGCIRLHDPVYSISIAKYSFLLP